MVSLSGYHIIDVMEITSKAAMQLGANSGIKTWGDEILSLALRAREGPAPPSVVDMR